MTSAYGNFMRCSMTHKRLREDTKLTGNFELDRKKGENKIK